MRLMMPLIVATTFLSLSMGGVDAAEPAPRPQPRQTAKQLDLRPPTLLRVATAEQINEVLSRAVDPQLERVEVEAQRLDDLPFVDRSDPVVRTVFDTVVRWLSPSTLYASRVNYTPNDDAYRPVPVSLSNYHPNFPPPHAQR